MHYRQNKSCIDYSDFRKDYNDLVKRNSHFALLRINGEPTRAVNLCNLLFNLWNHNIIYLKSIIVNRKRLIYSLALIICLGSGFSSRVDAAFWDMLNPKAIPIYPAFEQTSKQKLIINGVEIYIEMYKGENISIPHVVDYYNATLVQKGWRIQEEQSMAGNNIVLNFMSKDNRFLQLILFSGEKFGRPDSTYMYMRYSLEGIDKWISRNSETDNEMPGQDIPWLKRYPGSIRISSISDDKGMIRVAYIVPNHSCLECVAAFFKEEMAGKEWELLRTAHKSKEDMIKDISSFDLGKLLEKAPEEYKERLNSLGKSLSDMKKRLGQYKHSMPDETKTIYFKNGRDICTIGITYNNSQGDRQAQQGREDELKEAMEKYMEGGEYDDKLREVREKQMKEMVKKNRLAYLKDMQEQSEETITISIMYVPKSKLKERQKTWF